MPPLPAFGLILLMLLLNGLFSAYEMALASISSARLHVLAGKKAPGAADAVFMKAHMEASLAVIQLGVTLCGAVAAAVGGAGAVDRLMPLLVDKWNLSPVAANAAALVLVILPLSAVTIIAAELVPKMIALNYRERVCLGLSPAMRGLFLMFFPVVRAFEGIVRFLVGRLTRTVPRSGEDPGLHELQAAAALARTSRLIGASQEKIVLSAAQLSSRPVSDIAIPINDISTVNLSDSLSQALIHAHMDMHTRFPVVSVAGDPQTAVGYINFKDIMAALKLNPDDPSVRGIVRPIARIEGERSIAQALETMMREKQHIALVSSQDQVTGLVTLEDIIEELVGEIEDEFDRLPGYVHPFAGGWIMGGGVAMADIAARAGGAFTGPPEGKLADWCARHGIDVARGGVPVEIDGLRVAARKFRRRRVSEAAVSVVTGRKP